MPDAQIGFNFGIKVVAGFQIKTQGIFPGVEKNLPSSGERPGCLLQAAEHFHPISFAMKALVNSHITDLRQTGFCFLNSTAGQHFRNISQPKNRTVQRVLLLGILLRTGRQSPGLPQHFPPEPEEKLKFQWRIGLNKAGSIR
jgi:hypothetical protein